MPDKIAISKIADSIGRAWNMSALTYSQGARINVLDNCFAFMFTNLGDTIAFVNDMVIFPSATFATSLGDSRSIGAHVLDLYRGRIDLRFAVPVGAAPLVEIVQLFYISAATLRDYTE